MGDNSGNGDAGDIALAWQEINAVLDKYGLVLEARVVIDQDGVTRQVVLTYQYTVPDDGEGDR